MTPTSRAFLGDVVACSMKVQVGTREGSEVNWIPNKFREL